MAAAALEEARANGWWFKPAARSGHAFGRLRCSHPGSRPENACTVAVYSTSGPADGSETARNIREALRKCPHDPPSRAQQEPEGLVRVLGGRLAVAARLLDSAEALVEALEQDTEAQRVWETLELGDDSRMVEQETILDQLDRDATRARARGQALAADTGLEDPWPPGEGAGELLDAVAQILEEIAAVVMTSGDLTIQGKHQSASERMLEISSRL